MVSKIKSLIYCFGVILFWNIDEYGINIYFYTDGEDQQRKTKTDNRNEKLKIYEGGKIL